MGASFRADEITVTAVVEEDGRVVAVEYSDGEREACTYDEHGRVVEIHERAGARTT